MSFGALFRTGGNEVLIDQNYRCFEVIQTGTLDFYNGFCDKSFLGVPDNFVPLIAPPIGLWIQIGQWNSGLARLCAFSDGAGWESAPNWSGSIGYAILAPRGDGAIGGAGYGMAVYDALGRVVFSTNRAYSRHRRTMDINIASMAQSPVTYAHEFYGNSGEVYLTPLFCGIHGAFAQMVQGRQNTWHWGGAYRRGSGTAIQYRSQIVWYVWQNAQIFDTRFFLWPSLSLFDLGPTGYNYSITLMTI